MIFQIFRIVHSFILFTFQKMKILPISGKWKTNVRFFRKITKSSFQTFLLRVGCVLEIFILFQLFQLIFNLSFFLSKSFLKKIFSFSFSFSFRSSQISVRQKLLPLIQKLFFTLLFFYFLSAIFQSSLHN